VRLTPGTRVGPYEVVALLGAGGMAEVYRAKDTRLGREVAIKVMSEALGGEGPLLERFEREARLASSLNHPNVVALYDVGLQDGKPYFVTELLQGESLRDRLTKGPIPLATALEWGAQIAQGLAAAHERGIVHRDLKPENVFVTRDGHVKVIDFGIAKLIEGARETAPHGLMDQTVSPSGGSTGTGMVLGTPGYMSPEQVRGDPIDARTDFFSLGAVLYEILSGHRAFPAGPVVESGYAILHAEPEALPATIPAPVSQVVRRCLEKDPGRRFHSADDLAFNLELLRNPTGLTTPAIQPSPTRRRRRWWWLAIPCAAALLVAVGFRFGAPLLAQRSRTAADPGTAAGGRGPPSIAVLPFVNLSSDKEQEYFSDGISEELLDALARVKGLKVAGRTSSFHFKGKNEDLRTIAETLGVANVLEGSVRKQGNRVRITAQLTQVADGFHLWSKTFDGDLTDVFELQERIARAITNELKVVLQGEQRTRLVPVATVNPEAYALYLQATAIFNRRDGKRFREGIGQLEKAVRLDPDFGRAWSRLATLQVLLPEYATGEFDSALAAAEQAAHRAIALDPSLAEPHAVLGSAYQYRRRWLEAREAFRRALELDPDDVTANFWFGATLMEEGYTRQSSQLLDKVLAIDPIQANAMNWRGIAAAHAGDLDLAERLMLRSQDLGLAHAGFGLSLLASARGRTGEAVRQMTRALDALGAGLPPGSAETIARGAFGDVQARDKAVALVEGYLATRPAVVAGAAPYALLWLGRTGRALEVLEGGPTSNDAMAFPALWGPEGRAARISPAFPEFARRTGLADLWERGGAPDLCHRVGPRDYACR
jgi:serine/threonine protein kinase/tetratricopeptide (TPR) repeat protein